MNHERQNIKLEKKKKIVNRDFYQNDFDRLNGILNPKNLSHIFSSHENILRKFFSICRDNDPFSFSSVED